MLLCFLIPLLKTLSHRELGKELVDGVVELEPVIGLEILVLLLLDQMHE